ncbi:MAG TPA: hypothetical protein VFP39_05235 [Gemmatimonadales bacterium]|nr:hypothetical protein [Gemmatimonadales bacterium]
MITDSLGPISFGLFIIAVFGTLAAGAAFVLAVLLKKSQWARVIAWVEAGGLALYAGIFLITSLASPTQELAVGTEKHICEVDCHLAYSVAGVKTAKVWGGKTAQGMFYVITVRVRFDSGTIASWRPRDVPVSPNGRSVALIDAQGRRYPAPTDALDRQLLPGQAYTTDFVFDVPADGGTPRLELESGDWPTHLMIAHENAFLHGKVLFRLAA